MPHTFSNLHVLQHDHANGSGLGLLLDCPDTSSSFNVPPGDTPSQLQIIVSLNSHVFTYFVYTSTNKAQINRAGSGLRASKWVR